MPFWRTKQVKTCHSYLTSVGDIGWTHHATDLLHVEQIGGQTAVHAKDLFVHNGGHGQAVEAISKSLPQLDVVTTLALVIETIDAVRAGTLVVAAQDEEVLGVLDLVSKQEADHLERLFASVNVVTQEQVVGLGREPTVLEQTQQIVVLSVDVSTDLDGGLEFE
jgi:hypothetical protein